MIEAAGSLIFSAGNVSFAGNERDSAPGESVSVDQTTIVDTIGGYFSQMIPIFSSIFGAITGQTVTSSLGVTIAEAQLIYLGQLGITIPLAINQAAATIVAAIVGSSAGDTLSGFGSFASLFAASGGYIRGPGSGTSDSIPAMLSNGEFVINAEATKRNKRLLEAINSNEIAKFASGGAVGVMSNINETPRSTPQSVQQININITGDISRQTRAEVIQMLPSIAEGVNIHNREKGYRR
jgi:hypothetical protein